MLDGISVPELDAELDRAGPFQLGLSVASSVARAIDEPDGAARRLVPWPPLAAAPNLPVAGVERARGIDADPRVPRREIPEHWLEPELTPPLPRGDPGAIERTSIGAGLALLGTAPLMGRVDVRWCHSGEPRSFAIRWPVEPASGAAELAAVAGALELRLYGCRLAAIEVPPGVRVVAAGCTFDAGSRAAAAIRAGSAEVWLRHCTLHGAVEAGVLRANSCVFAGAVRVARRQEGWLRHSLLPARGGAPRAHRCLDSVVQLASTSPASPFYLRLADINGAAALANGEQGRLPGAHDTPGRRPDDPDAIRCGDVARSCSERSGEWRGG